MTINHNPYEHIRRQESNSNDIMPNKIAVSQKQNDNKWIIYSISCLYSLIFHRMWIPIWLMCLKINKNFKIKLFFTHWTWNNQTVVAELFEFLFCSFAFQYFYQYFVSPLIQVMDFIQNSNSSSVFVIHCSIYIVCDVFRMFYTEIYRCLQILRKTTAIKAQPSPNPIPVPQNIFKIVADGW